MSPVKGKVDKSPCDILVDGIIPTYAINPERTKSNQVTFKVYYDFSWNSSYHFLSKRLLGPVQVKTSCSRGRQYLEQVHQSAERSIRRKIIVKLGQFLWYITNEIIRPGGHSQIKQKEATRARSRKYDRIIKIVQQKVKGRAEHCWVGVSYMHSSVWVVVSVGSPSSASWK